MQRKRKQQMTGQHTWKVFWHIMSKWIIHRLLNLMCVAYCNKGYKKSYIMCELRHLALLAKPMFFHFIWFSVQKSGKKPPPPPPATLCSGCCRILIGQIFWPNRAENPSCGSDYDDVSTCNLVVFKDLGHLAYQSSHWERIFRVGATRLRRNLSNFPVCRPKWNNSRPAGHSHKCSRSFLFAKATTGGLLTCFGTVTLTINN